MSKLYIFMKIFLTNFVLVQYCDVIAWVSEGFFQGGQR